MKPYYSTVIEDSYLGGELLHSSSKCRSCTYKVIFGGAEKIGCQWKVNLILSCICSDITGECCNGGAFSSNMFVIAEPGQKIRFEHYLGVNKKEVVERSDGNSELCDRFFPVKYIKFMEIETDHIRYEICFI